MTLKGIEDCAASVVAKIFAAIEKSYKAGCVRLQRGERRPLHTGNDTHVHAQGKVDPSAPLKKQMLLPHGSNEVFSIKLCKKFG
jgi:hypothetical protein